MKKQKDSEIVKLEKRAKAAREKLKEARICKELGIKPFPDMSTRAFKARLKKQALELPKEKRQQILDAYHDRENPVYKTWNGIAEAFGVTFNDVLGVVELNTKIYRYTVVEKETK